MYYNLFATSLYPANRDPDNKGTCNWKIFVEEILGASADRSEEAAALALLLTNRQPDEEAYLDRRRKIAAYAGGIAAFCAILLIVVIAVRSRRIKRRPITIQGAVMVQNVDTKKESPIADVEISAANGMAAHDAKSDFRRVFPVDAASCKLNPANPSNSTSSTLITCRSNCRRWPEIISTWWTWRRFTARWKPP